MMSVAGAELICGSVPRARFGLLILASHYVILVVNCSVLICSGLSHGFRCDRLPI